jgi:hypothetical protein
MKLDMRIDALQIVPESEEEKLTIRALFLGLGGKFDEWVPNTSPIVSFQRERPEELPEITHLRKGDSEQPHHRSLQ